MSSQSIGFMQVVLPKDKVVEFEDWFCEDNPHAFKNITLKMTHNGIDPDRENYRERHYEVGCYSLLSTLIENRDDDISVICKETEVDSLSVEVVNTYELFREEINYKNGVCKYVGKDFDTQSTEEYELPQKSEMVAE